MAVAPRAGAWIETFCQCVGNKSPAVAPRAGAYKGAFHRIDGCWIQTDSHSPTAAFIPFSAPCSPRRSRCSAHP